MANSRREIAEQEWWEEMLPEGWTLHAWNTTGSAFLRNAEGHDVEINWNHAQLLHNAREVGVNDKPAVMLAKERTEDG